MDTIKAVSTERAPAAIGPYSQAVQAGDYLFLSGQIPVNPRTGEIVPGGIREQTEQVLFNIAAILQANQIVLDRVVRTDVFLTDMKDFKAMNDVYAAFFTSEVKPARQTVQVAGLPKGSLVEISCIVYIGDK